MRAWDPYIGFFEDGDCQMLLAFLKYCQHEDLWNRAGIAWFGLLTVDKVETHLALDKIITNNELLNATYVSIRKNLLLDKNQGWVKMNNLGK